jgi:hypothetical protein
MYAHHNAVFLLILYELPEAARRLAELACSSLSKQLRAPNFNRSSHSQPIDAESLHGDGSRNLEPVVSAGAMRANAASLFFTEDARPIAEAARIALRVLSSSFSVVGTVERCKPRGSGVTPVRAYS